MNRFSTVANSCAKSSMAVCSIAASAAVPSFSSRSMSPTCFMSADFTSA